jgi:hypothetical protein
VYENRPGDEGMGGEETDVRVVHLEEQIGERRGGVGYEVGEDGVMVSTATLQLMDIILIIHALLHIK